VLPEYQRRGIGKALIDGHIPQGTVTFHEGFKADG